MRIDSQISGDARASARHWAARLGAARPGAVSQGRRGFTLIELLVVLGVVALLVSLLVPALSKARTAARQTVCLTQIRTLQTAQQIYADAHNGALVDAGLPHAGVLSTEALRGSWTVKLAEYYGQALVLRSPGDRSSRWPESQGGRSQGLTLAEALNSLESGVNVDGREIARTTSYGINDYLSRSYHQDEHPLSPFDTLRKIQFPSGTVQFLMMAREGEYSASDHVHSLFWSNNRAFIPRLAATMVETGAWGGTPRTPEAKANYGFLDGHAALHPLRDVFLDQQNNLFNPALTTGVPSGTD